MVYGTTAGTQASTAAACQPDPLPAVSPARGDARDGRKARNLLSGQAVRARGSGRMVNRTVMARGELAAQLAQERLVALELQRAILPLHDEPFDLPGLRVAMRYLPASQASRVGGDWYITAEMPTDQVLVAIGDVGGHGLAAAAGMARLRGALVGLAVTGAPPERLVSWLNDLVHLVSPEHSASVVAGYFDPAARRLAWAQAGHPPPVLVRGSSATALAPPQGIMLGAAKEAYQAAVLDLLPGDLLILYTDGLIESRHRPLDEGLGLLCRAVRGVTDPELAIAGALSALGGTDVEDDTCLVALHVL